MLRTNIKNPQTRVTIEVTNYDEYTEFEEGVYRSAAENRYLEIAESIRLLCQVAPEFDKIDLVEKFEACSESYIERALENGLGQIDIFEGYEVTYSGEAWEVELFEAAAENGCSIAEWYLEVEDLSLEEKAKVYWLIVDCFYLYGTTMRNIGDLTIYEATLEDTANSIFNDQHLSKIPSQLQSCVDRKRFANDLRMSGFLREFEFAGHTWTISGY